MKLCSSLTLTGLVCALAGCVRFGFTSEEQAPSDLLSSELLISDTLSDLPPEGGMDDAQRDVKLQDVGTDMVPVDAVSADLANDAQVVDDPCVLSTQAAAWSNNMVGCEVSSRVLQCDAATYCNTASGWHLCTAGEYLANGGAQNCPVDAFWLASCARQGDAVFAPTDDVCAGDCKLTTAPSMLVSWACTGTGTLAFQSTPNGVITSAQCRRIGIDDPSTEAFWRPQSSSMSEPGVVCCR